MRFQKYWRTLKSKQIKRFLARKRLVIKAPKPPNLVALTSVLFRIRRLVRALTAIAFSKTYLKDLPIFRGLATTGSPCQGEPSGRGLDNQRYWSKPLRLRHLPFVRGGHPTNQHIPNIFSSPNSFTSPWRWLLLTTLTCLLTLLLASPSLPLSPSPPPSPSAPLTQAQTLDTQAHHLLQTSQPEAALQTWQQAADIYRTQPVTPTTTKALISNQINQAQALRVLGYYQQARQTLEQLIQDLDALPPSALKVSALQSLGVTLRVTGDLQQSQDSLIEALELAQSLQMPTDEVSFSLTKTLAALGNADQALKQLQQIEPNTPRLEIEIALFQLTLWQQQQQLDHVTAAIPNLQAQLMAQPANRWGVYAQVNLAAIATNLEHTAPPPNQRATANLLSHAIQQARTLSDTRAESYALGQLGHLYESVGQTADAMTVTQQALTLAHQVQAPDLVAKWQWQQGRLLKKQAKPDQAIVAYTSAVKGLEALQQDLVTTNPEVQFSFREQVEPVYRQLIDLLLANVDALPSRQQQQRLTQARSIAESLQLAELQNYFREACLTYQTRSIETLDPHAAIIYPILLSDRLEVIVSVPHQPLQHHVVDINQAAQKDFFNDVYWRLHPLNNATDVLPLAQTLYDWVIRPVETALNQQAIETLVFVPDGFLRSLPMGILHDGEQYLLEKYQVALTPGMQLLNSQPLSPDRLTALTMGLSEARDGFVAIPAVEQELSQINTLVDTKTLLNEAFTKENFFNQVQNTPTHVVHLATHGQFSSSAANTFLLAWDDRINVKDLDRLFRQGRDPIELLVLSACQTASGDDRAALGMAGIAVRSGARSTLATLWSVADNSTAELMAEFYHLLTQSNISRAEALRQAQLTLLHSDNYNHPYYWSPFVLVGNWQ